jgi:hypothetical protein
MMRHMQKIFYWHLFQGPSRLSERNEEWPRDAVPEPRAGNSLKSLCVRVSCRLKLLRSSDRRVDGK